VERPTDFQDIESHPGDTLSLMGINVVVGYLAPKQKKKCCSRRKTLPSDEEEEYNSFSKDSWGNDDPGPLWNPPWDQMAYNEPTLYHTLWPVGVRPDYRVLP